MTYGTAQYPIDSKNRVAMVLGTEADEEPDFTLDLASNYLSTAS